MENDALLGPFSGLQTTACKVLGQVLAPAAVPPSHPATQRTGMVMNNCMCNDSIMTLDSTSVTSRETHQAVMPCSDTMRLAQAIAGPTLSDRRSVPRQRNWSFSTLTQSELTYQVG